MFQPICTWGYQHAELGDVSTQTSHGIGQSAFSMIKWYDKMVRSPAKTEVVWQVSKIYHVYGSLWVAFRFLLEERVHSQLFL